MRQKVLFICIHNSARSQMAETFLKHLFSNKFEVFSAGTEPSKINTYVMKVMAEVGFDLSNKTTKNVKEFLDFGIDIVVTVCDGAKKTCPFFPGAKKDLHQAFPDPSSFTGSDYEILENVRKVRDDIKAWIESTFDNLD